MSSALATEVPPEDMLDAVFRALADRTRRALLLRLKEGPAKVTELARPFDMSLPAVGKHLRYLQNAGLIERSIDGRVHMCSLRAEAMREADLWLRDYRGFWTDQLDALAAYLEDDSS